MARQEVQVSYSQLAVFDSGLASPFNDWRDEHVRQGFSWRPGSVSFRTLEVEGKVAIDILRRPPPDDATSSAERIIVVPFAVPEHCRIEIASIGDSVPFQLGAGEYELTFEHGRNHNHGMWANFYFRNVAIPIAARIVRADSGLSPPADIVMTAEPHEFREC